MLRLLTAGESHGPDLVTIVEGLPAGIRVEAATLDRDLARRQAGYGRGARSTKIERDLVEVTSGVRDGRTTGAPVTLRIPNRDFANQPSHPAPLTAPRPGHADLAGRMKYGIDDFRTVRERASARETASRVAAGAIAKELLDNFGVRVGSFVVQIADVRANLGVDLGQLDEDALASLFSVAEADPVRCPDAQASERMRAAIDRARSGGETVGGVFCVFATGVPGGLGSYVQWDRKLDGLLARGVCSIPAVKGVEIGPAFEVAAMPGTRAQDSIGWRDGTLVRGTNMAGGLEGGVTNGQPVVLRAAMKPLSSVRARVPTVDFLTGHPADAPYVRSDVCAVPAAGVVAEAMVAWVLAEALVERFGSDRLDAMLAAWKAVRTSDLPGDVPPVAAHGETGRT